MKPLVYIAHPRLDRSEISGPLFDVAGQTEGVTCVDLYGEYPTFEIDVAREQRRLVDHDAIVFLHPIYWYSAPAIVREWQDLVLEHGFAYGKHGHALDGKVTLNAVSCGALESSYRPEGGNGAYLRDLLAPFEKTADLCGMRYLAPFAIYGAGRAVEEARRGDHVAAWRGLLTALRDDRLDIPAARAARTLNDIAASHAAAPETA
ncbi:NAD(P)H-dependent oxidoreductase [Tropicimonas marinistellae]|uniref:NAD(P)H-dependent oxidoreductase n=1 Tax=Tropicimonas marinistellae TaxID=1739787 RepID=UPI00082A3C7A|nr:NAD(P)H-dependent oxidoreductase [Tropicimonas marinistellae]